MGSEARTRLGLWFMLVIALFSFNQVFATGDYPGPAILGMLAATGLAVAGRRFGLGSPSNLLLSGIALVWYLSFVFQADKSFFGLPTPDSLTALWHSVSNAVGHSNVDFAPVPIRPGYAVLVVGAMWAATAVGELATFRWRRPLLASLLPVAIFTVSLTVGTGTGAPFLMGVFFASVLTYAGLESSHRLRSWGRWVSAWRHQRETEPAALTGPMARRLGASAIAVALVSPLFLPALGDGLFPWRSGIGSGGPGSGSGGSVDPWVSIQTRLVSQSGEGLFSVEADHAAYWRVASLEVFDGVAWHEESRGRISATDGTIGGRDVRITKGEALDQTLHVTGLRGDALPTATRASTVVQVQEGVGSTEDIAYDVDSGAVLVDGGVEEGDEFRVRSIVPDFSYKELVEDRPGAPGAAYFQHPQLSEAVTSLLDRWTAKADSPFAKLVAIQTKLRGFDYDLNPEELQGNYLDDFLLRTRQGYCQQFATAFAILARAAGYPSRVSVGFLPGASDVVGGEYSVSGTDAHSWPEVYFEDHGWIPFEPTPRDIVTTPTYTTAPIETGFGNALEGSGANNPFSSIGQGGAGISDPFSDVGGAAPLQGGLRGQQGGAGGGAADERINTRWQKTFSLILRLALLLFLLFLLVVPALKELRTRRRYARAGGPDDIAEAAFVQFQEEAAELASPRGLAESALSYARRISGERTVAGRGAVRLASIYEAAAYAARDITAEQAGEARSLARSLRSQLWHGASWWNRATRLFSPRHLRA